MATRFSAGWLEELRARADIISVVSEYTPLKQRGQSYWGLCPFHGEKTPSFKVDPDQGLYYCFGCKAGGSVIQFVMDAERMEFSEAVHYLADKVNLPLPEMIDNQKAEQERSRRDRIQALNRRAAHFFHETLYRPEGEQVLSYLHGRGLDDPAIRSFGLGAAPPGWEALTRALMAEGATAADLVDAGLTLDKNGKTFDMFRNRAIFPIINAHGVVLGFGGRAMGDVQPKYLNTSDTPAFNKRHHVYAANLLRKARGLSRVLLVEGYMDVVSLVRQGVVGVVATLGTSLTPEQAKLIKRYAPEIWIAYDGDSAGQNATLRGLDVLSALDIPAKVLVIPGGMDPDEFIRSEGRAAFEAIRPQSAPMYRMQRAAEGLDLALEEDRMRYAIACAAILKTVRQPVELESLLKRLEIDSGFSREVLVQQIGMTPPPKPAPQATSPRERQAKRQAQTFLPEHIRAERMLLSLMGTEALPDGMIEAQRFTDPVHVGIAEDLLLGKSPPEMLEACADEEIRAVMLEIFADPPQMMGDERMQVAADCLEKMRRGWIDHRINALTESLPSADRAQKMAAMKEIEQLNREKARMFPGRKESDTLGQS